MISRIVEMFLGKLMKSLIVILIAIFVFVQDFLQKFWTMIDTVMIGLVLVVKSGFPFLLALFGGLADYFINMRENHEIFSLKKAMINTFVAGFSGLLVIQLCNFFKLDSNILGFLCGISGFAGVRALKFFELMTKKITTKLATLRFTDVDKNNNNDLQLDSSKEEHDNKEESKGVD